MPDGGDGRWVDVSVLPGEVADAVALLVAEGGGGQAAGCSAGGQGSREHWGDLVQAAETVKGFAEARLLDAASALVEDVASDHGVATDDPRFAQKVAVHRKGACRAVVQEVQLLTGSTLTAARERVRFATAMSHRVGGAHALLRSGGCSWERARLAYSETAHLDPVLAGQVIDRLLAPPSRTSSEDESQQIPLSHSGFRARVRRQLALVDSVAADRKRRHRDAVAGRDACTFPGRDGTATFQATGDAVRVFAAQQRVADLAKAARAAGDERPLAQLRADIAVDLLLRGVVPGDDCLGAAPAGRLHVIVDLASILPDGATGDAAMGVGEVPGLGFLSADQVRPVAVRAGSTWARLVTDPVTGQVIDAAKTYRVPAGMARLIKGRDHTCRAPGDCGVPAGEADLDHDVEYQPGVTAPGQGATHPENVHVMHRGHHNTKTGRFWSSRQHGDGSISWRTLTRRLRTTPFDHQRPVDHGPPVPSWFEQKLGIRVALCREHDVVPNVFTDLADLQLFTDDDNSDECGPRWRGPGRCEIRLVRHPVYLDLPDPPPPF